MKIQRAKIYADVEAVLIVAAEPVTVAQLAQAFGVDDDDVKDVLHTLRADYDGQAPEPAGEKGYRRGFELRESVAGWRLYSRAEHHDTVKAFLTRGQSAKLSQAALETLAVVAYAQPVTRARISAIRGVNVDGVVRTLLMRGLIVEQPSSEEHGPAKFVTSNVFLESLGLASLEELPDIAPYLPAGDQIPADD